MRGPRVVCTLTARMSGDVVKLRKWDVRLVLINMATPELCSVHCIIDLYPGILMSFQLGMLISFKRMMSGFTSGMEHLNMY